MNGVHQAAPLANRANMIVHPRKLWMIGDEKTMTGVAGIILSFILYGRDDRTVANRL